MKRTLAMILLGFIILSSLGCKKKPVAIKGQEREAVLAYANPIADNILQALNEGNHVNYIRDFDETARNAAPENVFKQTRDLIISKIGKYVSREVSRVYKKDQYIVVLYRGKFENEERVRIRVIFQKIGDKNLVSGLWFNSPKLRK